MTNCSPYLSLFSSGQIHPFLSHHSGYTTRETRKLQLGDDISFHRSPVPDDRSSRKGSTKEGMGYVCTEKEDQGNRTSLEVREEEKGPVSWLAPSAFHLAKKKKERSFRKSMVATPTSILGGHRVVTLSPHPQTHHINSSRLTSATGGTYCLRP